MGLGAEYLEIALRLGRLVPDWIEGYVGPPDVADIVDRGEPVDAADLRERVQELAGRVSEEEGDPERRAWLNAQLRAISTALGWRSGEAFDYVQLFVLCHGGEVEHVPESQFEDAHALLDRALPGSGGVQERYLSWRQTQLVPRERLQEGLEALAAEMRRRSHAMFELPHDESVAWELVS